MMTTVTANLVDLFNHTIYPARIEIQDGRISAIHRIAEKQNHFILPGFIDAHIHIESSILPPSEFARIALPHGILATVSDPHEIGNVLGIQGVEYMMENGSEVPFKFYFGAPSCVPATDFETAGARLGPEEIRTLLKKKEIRFLTEMMNVPGVLHHDSQTMAKIAVAKELHKKIDGHAPKLRGKDLKTYVAAGIDTDHECTTVDEAREKIALGMKILIREGSAARDFDALFPLLLESPEHCMLCSDDVDPETLLHGGVNLLVKKAVQRGADVMDVLRAASKNPIEHYGLDVGMLRVGDPADFIEVNNLQDFQVLSTYVNGHCVAKNNQVLFPRVIPITVNRFNATVKREQDFKVAAKKGPIKVIEAIDGLLITKKSLVEPLVMGREISADPKRDLLKICVVNRYKDVVPSVAFIKNFGLKQGAIATSVAHDSHNIIAIAADDASLCKAVNCIIRHRGGMAVVTEDLEECLPLPIAGLMSDQEGHWVAKEYKKLEKLAQQLGCKLTSPFMTLSFMALLVIPELKISDLGLFDGEKFAFTEL